MPYNKSIVEKLSQFNNLSFTKKQWDIILKGCGCPKSSHFWDALKNIGMNKTKFLYTLLDIDYDKFDTIWNTYCEKNTAYVKKSQHKKRAKELARKRVAMIQTTTLYLVNGCLTHINPTEE